jgi:hypothetical protein
MRIDDPGPVGKDIAPADDHIGAQHHELWISVLDIAEDKPPCLLEGWGFEKCEVLPFPRDNVNSRAKTRDVFFRNGHDLIGHIKARGRSLKQCLALFDSDRTHGADLLLLSNR